MYFHGSPTRLEPGTILQPGRHLGLRHNGACSAHVYMTCDTCFSLTEAQDVEYFGARTTREYAIYDAAAWGRDEHDEAGFVHVVEPLGPVEADPHVDVDPDCVRTTHARVVAVFSGADLPHQIHQWERHRAATAQHQGEPMDAIKVTFEETVRTTSRVFLHEDHVSALESRFGEGPYSAEQLAEFLEEDQIVYFDEDEAEIMSVEVPEREIETAVVVKDVA